MSIVNYSLSVDFGDNFDPGIFSQELRDSTITTAFQSISEGGDDIQMRFKGTLSGSEITTLNALVAAHNPNNAINGKRRVILKTNTTATKNLSYTQMGTFNYNGELYNDTITRIEIFSWADAGISSYDLRIMDVQNANVIAEVTGLTNTTMELNNLGTISNVPLDLADLEIQAKKNGGGSGNRFVYVGDVNIYFSS